MPKSGRFQCTVVFFHLLEGNCSKYLSQGLLVVILALLFCSGVDLRQKCRMI
jgi:hypothetical protein